MRMQRTEGDWGIAPPVAMEDAHTLTLPPQLPPGAGGIAHAAPAPARAREQCVVSRICVDAGRPGPLTLTF